MKTFTQESVRERIYKIKDKLIPEWERISKDAQVISLLDKWKPHIKKINEESQKAPEVIISLVGGTGAGKSTLLNALLDSRLLPVSNMRACTAAITEVSYSQDKKYHAEIEFMPREEWQNEMQLLKDDLKDFLEMQSTPGTNMNENVDEACSISRVARDKLKTVFSLPDDFQYSLKNIENLKEDKDISRALDEKKAFIKERDFKKFKKGISLYLDSKHKFWPIVTKVRASGPFEILSDGIKIVDLPGINDPNQAREAVTHNYLKTCNFVWIVFNIKRVLTKDTMALMQSEDFMRQILMDGRANALTFVGTASDDIDIETACEEFGLDDDAPEHEIVLYRNAEVRKEIKKQLEDMSSRMVQLARENLDRLKTLIHTIERSKVFTVSAREYMRIQGYSRTQNAILTRVEYTEIDRLKEHLAAISRSYGVEAQAQSHHAAIDLFVRELQRESKIFIENLDKNIELSNKQKEEVQRAVHTAQKFLEQEIKAAKELYKENLESNQRLLLEKLDRGFERGVHEVSQLSYRWKGMHWATIRAVVRRGGRFVGSTGSHNFSADISKPVMDTIMFAWADFFGDQMNISLDKACERLLSSSQKSIMNLLAEVMQIIEVDQEVYKSFEKLFETSEAILNEFTGQIKIEMQQQIDQCRKTLYEQIEAQVDANMQTAYRKAADERGTGMKQRMVNVLTQHAKDVAGTMFHDAKESISVGIRGLCDYLQRKYDEMKEAVLKQNSIAQSNLMLDSEKLSPEDIEKKKEQFQKFLILLEKI